MSNHVATITKNEGRCSFSRKALSVFMAVLLAFLMMPMIPAESAQAAPAGSNVNSLDVSTDWNAAVYADQSVKVTVGFNGDSINEGDTIDVVIKDAESKDVERTTLTLAEGQSEAVVDFTIPAEKAIVPGEYTVNLSNAPSFVGEISVSENTAANTNWSGHTPVMNVEPDADDEYYFSYDGNPVDFTVENVLAPNGEGIGTASYVFAYNEDSSNDGQYVAGSDAFLTEAPSAEGHYLVTVWPTAAYSDGAYLGVTDPIVIPFEIGPAAQSESYSLYQYDAKYPASTSDTSFVYTGNLLLGSGGTSHLIGLAVDGEAVPFENILNDSDFENPATKADGVYYNLESDVDVQDAGDYAIKVNKKTVDSGTVEDNGTVAYLTLTVDPFDLAGATVTASDIMANGTPVLTVVNGADTLTTSTAGKLDVKNVSFTAAKGVTQPAGVPSDWFLKGEYGLSVSPKVTDGVADKNFTGTATATVKVFDAVDTNFKYASNLFSYYTGGNSLVFDRSEGEAFDANQVSSDEKGANTSAKYYDIVFRDANGDVVSSPDAAGTYTAEVSVKSDLSYSMGGSATLSFRVVESEDVNVYFTVDGKPMTGASNSVEFTGEAIPYAVAVKAAGETVPASDYAVKVTNKQTGEEVSEVVDPGTYVISVESDKYAVSATCEFSVTEATYAGFEIIERSYGYDSDEYELPAVSSNGTDPALYFQQGIPYTGAAVDVAVRVYNVNSRGDKVYTELPSDYYTLTFVDESGKGVAAEDLSKVGAYTATIKLAQAAEDANIEDITAKTDSFSIIDQIDPFKDVHAADWYADEATKAAQMGYMQGMGGTSMLMPASNITRADMAIVLMRMAGGDDEMQRGETYPTPFSDVEADAYYAKAIDWAYKAGVVQGYEGSFRPNDFVSREELATMVARFAKVAMGQDTSVEDASAVLSGYADGSSVSDFAAETMAWCVESGVFGVGTDSLNPQGTAQRSEVAAISVRLMPAEEK